MYIITLIRNALWKEFHQILSSKKQKFQFGEDSYEFSMQLPQVIFKVHSSTFNHGNKITIIETRTCFNIQLR